METKLSFEEWHSKLVELAEERDIEWMVCDSVDYPTDGYDMGESPEEELEELIYSASIDND